MIDPDRGTGRTTKQMKEAPKGAVFIWCNQHIDYPRELARKLGRTDLIIYGPAVFENNGFRLHGVRSIVIDHAARIPKEHRAIAAYINREPVDA